MPKQPKQAAKPERAIRRRALLDAEQLCQAYADNEPDEESDEDNGRPRVDVSDEAANAALDLADRLRKMARGQTLERALVELRGDGDG